MADNKEKNFDYLDLKYYFVHSYLALTEKNDHTLAYCNYQDVVIPAVIKYDNIMGCQFHPEKSGKNGLNFLKGVIQKLVDLKMKTRKNLIIGGSGYIGTVTVDFFLKQKLSSDMYR